MPQPQLSRYPFAPRPPTSGGVSPTAPALTSGDSICARRSRLRPIALALGLSLAAAAAAHAVPVPQQLSPADGAALSNINIAFTWATVPFAGVVEYGIEIQYLEMPAAIWKPYKTQDDITLYGGGLYTFANFTKSDYGRWRVRTMTPTGNSPYSGWRLFSLENAAGFASPGMQEASGSVDVPAHQTWWKVVPCPSGTIVVGGGWRSGRPYHVRTYLSVQQDNGWGVGFENLTARTKTVEVFAQCVQGVSGYSFSVAESWSVVAGGVGSPIATCKKGVRSGGGFRAYSKDLAVFASEPISDPTPHSWLVFGHNGGGATQPIQAEAVCLGGTGATTAHYYSSAQSASPSGTVIVSRGCPAGRVALGGGFSSEQHTLVAMSTRRDGFGWKASGYNGGTQSSTLRAHVVCGKLQ